MKVNADKHRAEKEFEVGDWVFLKLQPFRQRTLAHGRTHKLSPRYADPFLVVKKVGTVAYQLKLPPQAKIHDVFHVVMLKKKFGTESVTAELPDNLMDDRPHFEPEAILDRGIKKKKDMAVVIWLIKWKNLPEEEATWEPTYELKKRFPTFHP